MSLSCRSSLASPEIPAGRTRECLNFSYHAYTLAVALLGAGQPDEAQQAFALALELNGSRMAVQLAILDVEFLQRDRPPLAGVDNAMRILNNALEAASL